MITAETLHKFALKLKDPEVHASALGAVVASTTSEEGCVQVV